VKVVVLSLVIFFAVAISASAATKPEVKPAIASQNIVQQSLAKAGHVGSVNLPGQVHSSVYAGKIVRHVNPVGTTPELPEHKPRLVIRGCLIGASSRRSNRPFRILEGAHYIHDVRGIIAEDSGSIFQRGHAMSVIASLPYRREEVAYRACTLLAVIYLLHWIF
jgi:hypothetical protein